MILFAIRDKKSGNFWRDRKDEGIELLPFDHCSVFTEQCVAEELALKHGNKDAELIEITLTTRAIPW